jgi:threonylcarbamoyladenosine tRNA methylthiotransferase MtaB
MRVIAEEERFAPHLHISAQSGDDMILKRMKRRHSRRDTIEFCTTVRRLRSDIAFGADLIAGFPTETEEMFENTLNLVDDAELAYLHVFPFSPRLGTPAARMPQLHRRTVKERAARLRGKGSAALRCHLHSLIGTEQVFVAETENTGRTACFAQVALNGRAQPGNFVRARVTGASDTRLFAEIA